MQLSENFFNEYKKGERTNKKEDWVDSRKI